MAEAVEAEIRVGAISSKATREFKLYAKDDKSYAEQFEALKGETSASILGSAFPKPSLSAMAKAPGATAVPGSGGIYTAPLQRPMLDVVAPGITPAEADAHQLKTIFWRMVGFILIPGFFSLGCFSSFTWSWFAASVGIIVLQSCFGIAMTYHRMLTHRAFRVPVWLEYTLAYIGTLSLQGSPIEWVCNHRWHHLHCDTPLDPHSPYEGLLHAHCGWLLKWDTERAFLDRSNVRDLTCQPFYQHLEAWWIAHTFLRLALTVCLGGWPAMMWLYCFPIMVSWNMAWIVNSAGHMWGDRPYDTGDLSTDNWLVNMFAFGDGWHNTHHAFPTSARHGLQWYQWDPVWYIVWGLEKVGLAWDVKLPTERDLQRRTLHRAPTSAPKSAAKPQGKKQA